MLIWKPIPSAVRVMGLIPSHGVEKLAVFYLAVLHWMSFWGAWGSQLGSKGVVNYVWPIGLGQKQEGTGLFLASSHCRSEPPLSFLWKVSRYYPGGHTRGALWRIETLLLIRMPVTTLLESHDNWTYIQFQQCEKEGYIGASLAFPRLHHSLGLKPAGSGFVQEGLPENLLLKVIKPGDQPKLTPPWMALFYGGYKA